MEFLWLESKWLFLIIRLNKESPVVIPYTRWRSFSAHKPPPRRNIIYAPALSSTPPPSYQDLQFTLLVLLIIFFFPRTWPEAFPALQALADAACCLSSMVPHRNWAQVNVMDPGKSWRAWEGVTELHQGHSIGTCLVLSSVWVSY